MRNWLKITEETVKEKLRVTALLTFIFSGLAAMYVAMYPSFEDSLEQFTDMPTEFIRGEEYLTSFVGYLNMEMYQIFWVLVLGILIAYLAASLISEELEAKTIDMLMSNPISRKKVVLGKFLGLLPLILIVNFAVIMTVYGLTPVIGEGINFYHLLLTHLVSMPYLLSISGISIFVSTIIDKKMKASITAMAIVVGMYIVESVSQLAPEYEKFGIISIVHYYDPSELLIMGNLDIVGLVVLSVVTLVSLSVAMFHFERRDLAI